MGTLLPLLFSVLLAGAAPAAKPVARPMASSTRYEAARSQLKALMRDPVKRRSHQNWDKAIKALLDSAVGTNAPGGTLEAARARYALYRWSANEADRDAALRLAQRAERLGAREAARFAAAIRREAGDDRPALPQHKEKPVLASAPPHPAEPRSAHPTPAPHAAPPVPSSPAEVSAPAPHDLEPATEPELEAAVADLKAPRAGPLPASATIGPPAGSATASPGDEDAGATRSIRRVVVDAGHGGLDPGAIGPTGLREKDVTLAMSRRLAQRLRQAGFEVIMTRSDDRYVALEERTALANARKGDLFVSIHANANPRRTLAGVETWILNVADDRYANRLAARENGVDPDEESGAVDARRILTDLDARSSTDASRQLAQQVQKEITASVRAKVGEVQDLGVKSALFYVLVGARMPAVLVETAFISNRREEQRLASAAYQEEVAAAVSRAVVGFAAQRGPRLARGP